MNQLVLLVVGFLLTTVVGGFLGYFFQNRAWSHQHRVTAASSRREAAFAVFEGLSTLMDKRLYRMRIFDDAIAVAGTTPTDIAAALEEYRRVRRDWNDNLNRNLARIEAYFGSDVRQKIESGVYRDFSKLDRELMANYQKRLRNTDVTSCAAQLDSLSHLIYDANVEMLRLLRAWEGRSGVAEDAAWHRSALRAISRAAIRTPRH